MSVVVRVVLCYYLLAAWVNRHPASTVLALSSNQTFFLLSCLLDRTHELTLNRRRSTDHSSPYSFNGISAMMVALSPDASPWREQLSDIASTLCIPHRRSRFCYLHELMCGQFPISVASGLRKNFWPCMDWRASGLYLDFRGLLCLGLMDSNNTIRIFWDGPLELGSQKQVCSTSFGLEQPWFHGCLPDHLQLDWNVSLQMNNRLRTLYDDGCCLRLRYDEWNAWLVNTKWLFIL
jgi:hypothetical protein